MKNKDGALDKEKEKLESQIKMEKERLENILKIEQEKQNKQNIQISGKDIIYKLLIY